MLHRDESILYKPVLFLEVSILQRPVTHVDVSKTPRGTELHLDTQGQEESVTDPLCTVRFHPPLCRRKIQLGLDVSPFSKSA